MSDKELKAHIPLLRDGGQRNNDYQQGYYDALSKVRALTQAQYDYYYSTGLKDLIDQIDALLHPPPAV
jgi:hypothetical protein